MKKIEICIFLIPLFFMTIKCSQPIRESDECLKEFNENISNVSQFARGERIDNLSEVLENYKFLVDKTKVAGSLDLTSHVILYDNISSFINDSIVWRKWYEKKCR